MVTQQGMGVQMLVLGANDIKENVDQGQPGRVKATKQHQ